MTTDEYFGEDTAIISLPENLKKDYAGKVVFMNVPRDVKERLENLEEVRWADIIGYNEGLTPLYAERTCAEARKNDGDETVFFKIPEDAPLLNVLSEKYQKFIEWSKPSLFETKKDGIIAQNLQEFGNFEGVVTCQGQATVLYLNNKYVSRGQIYPIERKSLVIKAIEKNFLVPSEIKQEVFEEEYSDLLENEYSNPPKQFRVEWSMDVNADNPMEAAKKALEIIRNADEIATTTFSVTNSMTGEEVSVDLDLDLDLDLDYISSPGM